MSNDNEKSGHVQQPVCNWSLLASSSSRGRSGLFCYDENLTYQGPSFCNPVISNCPSHPERHFIGRHSDSPNLSDYHTGPRNDSSHSDSPRRVKLPGDPLHCLKLCIYTLNQFENCLLRLLVWQFANKRVDDAANVCLRTMKQRREANERHMCGNRILFGIRLFLLATVSDINCRNPEGSPRGKKRSNCTKPAPQGSNGAPVESTQFTRDARDHNLCYEHRNPLLGDDGHSATATERIEIARYCKLLNGACGETHA
jgi:hypothetical protein